MAATAIDREYQGQGRPRKKKLPKTSNPSHYQFALWSYEDGKRIAVPVGGVRSDKRVEYPLISTTVMNEGTRTETLIWMHFDLDFKRADKKWIRDDKLDWPTVGATLAEDIPMFLRYLAYVVRSTGGKGLSLVLAISPLELIDETGDVQKLAFKVQDMIIRILNYHGMGADEGARGLKRLMPNVFRLDRVLDQADFVQHMIQKHRPRVLQNLLYALRFHQALRPQNKRDRHDILWPDTRVEKPLARLYLDLLDSVGPWGSDQMSARDIITRYGISKNTVYKLLGNPPEWLGVERLVGEGIRLTIRPDRSLTDRAYAVIERADSASRHLSSTWTIAKPEDVQVGERNRWLVLVVISCKKKGFGQAEIRAALGRIITRVPGWQKSQSLTRGLGSILRSLYHHRSSLKGSLPGLELPGWLIEALQPAKPKQLSQIFYKKGSLRGSHAPASQSMESTGPALEVTHSEDFTSPSRNGVRPGSVRAGQALTPVVETQTSELQADVWESVPSAVAETESSGFSVAGAVPSCENGALGTEMEGGNTYDHLSGSALSGTFSKALMKSGLPAAEKARILTEVTSETDLRLKDQLRRRWLSRLQSRIR